MIYEGSLNGSTMRGKVLRAYKTWQTQRQRCNNPNATSYEFWGAKGIQVEYSSREFIGWYLENISNKKFKSPVVSRIDHSKNYSLENVRMEERSENSKESTARQYGRK